MNNSVTAAPALPKRAGRINGPEYAILIEIPRLPMRNEPKSVMSSRSKIRIESHHRPDHNARARRPSRRRLKREVKVAAWFLMISLPLAFQASRVWSDQLGKFAANDLTRTADPVDGRERPGSSLTRTISRTVFEPAVVLMSIEPAQPGSKSEAESAVIFPGYVLPDDSLEEKAHEGS